jgi:hypothetical protein
MVEVGAGAHGALGVSHIAKETVNLRREICSKKRAPDAEATETTACYVVLLFRTLNDE